MKHIAFFPTLVIAGPAMAHGTDTVHIHDTSLLSLVMGLTLIAAGVGAAAVVRARSK